MLLFIAFCLIAFQAYRLWLLRDEFDLARVTAVASDRRVQELSVLVGALQRSVVDLAKAQSAAPGPGVAPEPEPAEERVDAHAPEPGPAPIEREEVAIERASAQTEVVIEPIVTMPAQVEASAAPVNNVPAANEGVSEAILPVAAETGAEETSTANWTYQSKNSSEAKRETSLEELIGGNLLNKLGALVLVIGIALFLSYSFGRSGPVGRALTGLGVSVGLLGAGVVLERRPRYKYFSRGVIAAGWASLYFTSYAMYALPATQIITNEFAGVCLMTAVAAGMVVHSLKYRVQALTALAYGCVFAALALSADNTVAVTALIPLAASALYLARRMQWFEMTPFAAAATYAVFASRPASGASLVAIESTLLVYWVMFEAFDLLRIAARQTIGMRQQALFAINAVAGIGASAYVWNKLAPETMWLYCAVAGSLYLASTLIRFAMNRDARYEFSLAIASILAALGVFSHVPGLWISTTMTVEAEILFLASLYPRLRWAKYLSWLAFVAAVVNLTSYFGTTVVWGAEVHQWAPSLGLLVAVFYLNRALSKQEVYFSYLASIAAAILIGGELPWGLAGIGWMVFGALLFEVGLRTEGLDLRLQSYALSLLGILGTAANPSEPLTRHNEWVLAFGVLFSLATALRARLSLESLSEIERRVIRFGGSVGTALIGAVLIHETVPAEYRGIAMLALSTGLFELALRGLPEEMLVPAIGLHLAGLQVFMYRNGIAKHPAQSVLISFGGATLVYYWLAARLRRVAIDASSATGIAMEVLGTVTPWIGSAVAFVELWMALPDPYVAMAYAAIAMLAVEVGVRLRDRNLVRLGRVLSLVSVVPVVSLFLLDIPAGMPRISNFAILAVAQWWIWYRTPSDPSSKGTAYLHGWVATCLIGGLIPLESGEHQYAWWGLFGSALTLAAKFFRVRELRWQAAVLGAIAGAWSMLPGTTPLWQTGVLAAWYLLALILEEPVGTGVLLRQAYSVGIAVIAAQALFNQIAGGMLTLSWSLEAIALLAVGFAVRERMLRLSGLALLLLCIGKVFFYDLRNLETMYRILSFIGLGICLLAVSWIYTRFKDQLQKYL